MEELLSLEDMNSVLPEDILTGNATVKFETDIFGNYNISYRLNPCQTKSGTLCVKHLVFYTLFFIVSFFI